MADIGNSYTSRFIQTIDPLIRNFTSAVGFKLRDHVARDYFTGEEHVKRQEQIGEAYYGTGGKVKFAEQKGDRYFDRQQLINAVKVTSADASKAGQSLSSDVARRTQELVDSLGKLEDKFILEGISGKNRTFSGYKILGDKETIPYDYWSNADLPDPAEKQKSVILKYGMNTCKALAAVRTLQEKGFGGPFKCALSYLHKEVFRSDPIASNFLTSEVKSMAQDVFKWDQITAFIPLECIPTKKEKLLINNVMTDVETQYAYVFSQNNIIFNEYDAYKTEVHSIWDEAGNAAVKLFGTFGAGRLEESGVVRIKCVIKIG